MRELTSTLLAAQKEATHTPYVKVEAKNKIAGVVRLDWERFYTGSEDDCFHAIAMPGDGSLIRVRLTPPADGRKFYRQRVTSPGPESDFGTWTYTSQYNCIAVAAASLAAEVSIFWVNTSRQIRRIESTDYGASWGSPELIDYSPTTDVNGLTAAYKPNGDLAIFFADGSDLYVKKHIGGSWQTKVVWDKSTGELSGVAVVYDADWNLVITGEDSYGNFKLWRLIYGDGGEVTPGTWSAFSEFASAPSDGDFEYGAVFLDEPDVYRCFYIERYTGTEAYNRPFWSHTVLNTGFIDSLWREPVPFDLSSEYGIAIAHYGDYCWLSTPFGVWRAEIAEESADLTADVVSLKQETTPNQGRLTIELRNDGGSYCSLPPPLEVGCQLEVSPGYVTSQGNEVSPGQIYKLETYEYVSSKGKSSLFLYALDGWGWINSWRARQQFRWNKTSEERNVRQMLEIVLARTGLKTEVESQSSVITGYYPDFTVLMNNRSEAVIDKLLSFVPDVLFIEGNKACLVNPLSSDSSVYSYGLTHSLIEGRYKKGAWGLNRVQVEGYDSGSDEPILVDSFSWSQITGLYDRMSKLEDRNIDTVTKAEQRGEACLRGAEIESDGSGVRIPVNCGQQLFDVIDITDNTAGLDAEKKRVLGIFLTYEPRRGIYEQRLTLGDV
ncbi:hypothetical protein ACFLTB_03995 [Chloroflexota bacterium]